MAAQRNQLVFVALFALVMVAMATELHATGAPSRKLLTDASASITKSGTKSDFLPDWTTTSTVTSKAPEEDKDGGDGIKAEKTINIGDFSLDKMFSFGG